jgi:hypothetical protein
VKTRRCRCLRGAGGFFVEGALGVLGWLIEVLAYPVEIAATEVAGEEAIEADPMEPGGQDVDQEAAE